MPDESVYDQVVVDEPVAEVPWQRSVLPVEDGDEADRVDGETEQDIEDDQVGHENVAAPAQCGTGDDGHEADGVGDDGEERDEAAHGDVGDEVDIVGVEKGLHREAK